jgi:hypothetical protein
MTVLPNKHVPLRSSILGLGAIILRKLQEPSSVSNLWERCRSIDEVASFERFTITLTFLHTLGAINYRDGVIMRVR